MQKWELVYSQVISKYRVKLTETISQIRVTISWQQAINTCRNSGLPNAELIKPLQFTEGAGVFETYRNLVNFLKANQKTIDHLWSGLSREKDVSQHYYYLSKTIKEPKFTLHRRGIPQNFRLSKIRSEIRYIKWTKLGDILCIKFSEKGFSQFCETKELLK